MQIVDHGRSGRQGERPLRVDVAPEASLRLAATFPVVPAAPETHAPVPQPLLQGQAACVAGVDSLLFDPAHGSGTEIRGWRDVLTGSTGGAERHFVGGRWKKRAGHALPTFPRIASRIDRHRMQILGGFFGMYGRH